MQNQNQLVNYTGVLQGINCGKYMLAFQIRMEMLDKLLETSKTNTKLKEKPLKFLLVQNGKCFVENILMTGHRVHRGTYRFEGV